MFSIVFKKSGNLFQMQGATYERLFLVHDWIFATAGLI